MADTVALVVSGKNYPQVYKTKLVEESCYFRALISGKYGDSRKDSYKLTGWSTKAFELLLQYVTNGTVDLRGRTLAQIKTALEVAEYLVVDMFKLQLARALIASWPVMKTEEALQLAEELNVLKELHDYAFIRVLTAKENQCVRPWINYDVLITVTGMESFWNFTVNQLELKEVLWDKVLQRYTEVLNLAVQLPPHADKAKALAQNLRLHILDSVQLRRVWNILLFMEPSSTINVLKNALKEALVNVRQDVRKIFSHIRLPFQTGRAKVNTFGVAEFNTKSWSWDVKEYKLEFSLGYALMKRDYATFLGKRGLLIMRMKNRFPVLIENSQLGEVIPEWAYGDFVCCISGKRLFILDLGTTKLYQFVFYSQEFSECGEIPVERAKLIGHGDLLYIVGYSNEDLCVFEYKVKSSELSVVVRSNCFGFSVQALLVIKRKIFIFSDHAYTIVDTLQKDDQELLVLPYLGFVPEMWDFEIWDVTIHEDGILMLLHASYAEENINPDLMVARLDTNTSVLSCLYVLPALVCYCDYIPSIYQFIHPQIEVRRPRDGSLLQNEDVMKRLRETCCDNLRPMLLF